MIHSLLVLFPFSQEKQRELSALLPDSEILYRAPAEYTPAELSRADVIFGNIAPAALSGANNLKWLHLASAGTDGYMDAARNGLLLTNGTGAYDVVLPEHMLALLFAVNMCLGGYRDSQKAHIWKRLGWSDYIFGKTCVMLGAGSIGCGFLRRMKALGAYTVGVRRSGSSKPDYVDEMYSMDRIDELLPRADILAMALPGTPETVNIMDARRIGLMKDGAKLINAGRGSAVDPQALAQALRSGHLSGAGIDVAYKEPLPADSYLWDVPNLVITPHIAGAWDMDASSPFMEDTVYDVFADNLADYLDGKPLRNLVDVNTGYRMTRK
jgi:phosphoglycerate dehydrogenase-like enzyme